MKKPDDWRDLLNFIFNGLIALSTIVGIIFLILQWRQTDHALSEAKEANRIARVAQTDASKDSIEQESRFKLQLENGNRTTQAAQESADQSKKAIEATIQIARQEQRAWVGYLNAFSANQNQDFIRTGEPVFFETTIKNFGKTPATNLTAFTNFRLLPKDAPFVADYGKPNAKSSVSTLAPTVELRLPTPNEPQIVPNETFVRSVRSGDVVVYVFGRIEYQSFGKRETTFCTAVERDLRHIRLCDTYNNSN